MCSFISYVAAILALLLCSHSGRSDDPVVSFPSEFLTNYFEYSSIRRVTLFSGDGSGVFAFGLTEMKKMVSFASSRSIQMNVLPFDQFLNSVSQMDNPFFSAQTVTPGRCITVIYDNSTQADRMLLEASSGNFFRAKYKWLFLTAPAFYEYLQNSLVDLEINVDSDVTIGIAHPDGEIKLLDIYVLGKIFHEKLIGEWKLNGNVSEENEDVSSCRNCSGKLTLAKETDKPFQRSNFNGFQLKVVTLNVNEFYSIVSVNPTNDTLTISGGYFGEVFKILSEALNFTYSANLLEGYAYGVVSSFSDGVPLWTGVVGELQSKRADMSACEVSLLPEREMIMDYSWPLQIISRRLYIHRPMRSGEGSGGSKSETTWYKGGGFVRPFAVHVWLCVTGSLLLFLAASRLHAHFTFPPQATKVEEPTGPPTLSSDFFRFISTLVQQGIPDDPDPDEDKGEVDSTQSRRLILWTASVTYLIVYTSYGAKLASILASESEPQPPFVDLAGLLMMSNWKLGFIDIGLGRVAFESAGPDTVMGRLWSERVKPDLSVLVPDIVSGVRKTLQGHYAFFEFHTGVQAVLVQSLTNSKDAIFTTAEVCRLLALPNDYLKGGIAFGFQEESPIRRIFNTWILAMRSCGVLDRLAKTWLPEALPCLEEPTVATVGLIDIAPALSALAFGVAVSIVVLLLEIIYDFHRNKRYKLPFYQ